MVPAVRSAQCVVVRLRQELFGFPIQEVREMVRAQPTAKVPGSPAFMRGVMNLRGSILPVVDLRLLLGMGSAKAELEALLQMLDDRRRDHESWLAELERCARTGDEFLKATDPHKCAFGRWYDGFTTDHVALKSELQRLDAPHKDLHATAVVVLALARRGDNRAAMALIEEKRAGAFSALLRGLEEVKRTLREDERELVVVVEAAGVRAGVAVDGIESVEPLAPKVVTGSTEPDLEMAIREGSSKLVCLLQTGKLLGGKVLPPT